MKSVLMLLCSGYVSVILCSGPMPVLYRPSVVSRMEALLPFRPSSRNSHNTSCGRHSGQGRAAGRILSLPNIRIVVGSAAVEDRMVAWCVWWNASTPCGAVESGLVFVPHLATAGVRRLGRSSGRFRGERRADLS